MKAIIMCTIPLELNANVTIMKNCTFWMRLSVHCNYDYSTRLVILVDYNKSII